MKYMEKIHPTALFRLSVLGQLISRDKLERGELRAIICKLAAQTYQIPGGNRVKLSERTIENWYYTWRHDGIEGLAPKVRTDKGACQLTEEIQQAICEQKKQYPRRSIDRIMNALEKDGVVAKKSLSRSSVHRLLTAHKLNKVPSSFEAQEHRSFEAMYAGQLWQGDVMHGPRITANGRTRKSYLVSWMDDASRLVTHSEFRLSEQKEEIEYVLKQGLIKRGLPYKIYIDNGSAYRSKTLQEACARLQIQVIFCKAYSPESKGKIERWHGTLRGQFLSEIEDEVLSLTELNIRFWRWLEQYNNATHAALGMSPNERYQRDLNRIRTLGPFAKQLDELFLHRHKRKVRKDGTISYNSQYYEVPYHLVGDYVLAVVQPENNQVIAVETLEGEALSKVNVLDKISNNYRKRH